MTALAYLGPEGTFTHQAATRLAAPGQGVIPLDTIESVYAAVQDGAALNGVVPIENSVEGYVVPSLDVTEAPTA